MFKSKYIFETKKTKFGRHLKNVSFLATILFILYSILGFLFILFSNHENRLSKEAFFKRPPDLITVFTGQSGRIPYAISLAKSYGNSPLFVTGVNAKNSVQTLVSKMTIGQDFDPNQLSIDYLARNTVENVLSTRRFLKSRHDINNVLIISHDYHIMRIKLIMDRLKSSNDKIKFFYTGIETDYTQFRNIKIAFKEVFKFLRTYGFLLLWTPDSPLL